MALVVHDPGVVGDVDPEGEDRDQFHIEEMLNEWTDEPLFRHDVYPESDGEDNADGMIKIKLASNVLVMMVRKREYGVIGNVTRNQSQAARKNARQWIEKEYHDQFARLRDYAAEIIDANPDSHVEVDCLTNEEGLIKGVSLEWPNIEHRMCVQHIYGNLKKNHGSKTRMKPLLWDLAWAYNNKDYKQKLEKNFCYDTVVFNDIMKTNPISWCRAFQRRGNYCEDVDKKFTESFNGSLNKAREKLFVAMLEAIRRFAMVRIAKRSVESHTHTGSCTPYVALVLSSEHKVASLAKMSTSTNGMYEVKHGSESHRVCLKSYTCTCQKWQICGIPSEPPEGDKKMTKEDKKRKKDVNESPTKKAPKNKKQIMHCGICGTADHNFRYHKKDKASQSVLQPSQPEPSQGSLTQV
ncbi:hypothetical protein ISN45_Aa05g006190 [Arabidopsis thaliana x Arabidopsis arenosa]|uniref:MULE transposase domain-containing protein n=1 Tax=Arabidopsis thaliana x Arabidopsis arenosa TaxID=1240361 RepID=A0A8T1ZL99_9BRAS|nr:hypothetical protein ISN45_Aa05g006190 [Arabidopsis thaliana x Arabidopsis arenosa]